jgi:hypothetical protein
MPLPLFSKQKKERQVNSQKEKENNEMPVPANARKLFTIFFLARQSTTYLLSSDRSHPLQTSKAGKTGSHCQNLFTILTPDTKHPPEENRVATRKMYFLFATGKQAGRKTHTLTRRRARARSRAHTHTHTHTHY